MAVLGWTLMRKLSSKQNKSWEHWRIQCWEGYQLRSRCATGSALQSACTVFPRKKKSSNHIWHKKWNFTVIDDPNLNHRPPIIPKQAVLNLFYKSKTLTYQVKNVCQKSRKWSYSPSEEKSIDINHKIVRNLLLT